MRVPVVLIVAALAAAPVAPAVGAEAPVPYLYEREGQGEAGRVTFELESGYGTREARPFGRHGFEQLVRARWQALSWLAAEVGGGLLAPSSGRARGSVTTELVFGPLNAVDHFLDLSVGLGYRFDYDEVHVPYLRLALGRAFGPFHVVLSGIAEIPTGGDRDEVDLILGLAGSYGITSWCRLGFELVAEDIEGYWEREEAEGGAKIVLGPTLAFAVGDHIDLRLNAGAILAATHSTPTRGAGETIDGGFLGRLAIGYSF